MKILYLDCFSGISGDMALGALLDAGASIETLQSQLKLLKIEGYSLQVIKNKEYGFAGTRFQVQLEKKEHPHRTWSDILQIIESSDLCIKTKQMVINIFQKLAFAEGKVHGVAAKEVCFHEVGAVDSIIDIVGTVVALQELGIEKICCSPLPTGHGYIHSSHGLLPIPAPATAELLKGIPVRSLNIEGELVTPTGAAMVAALAEYFGPLPAMTTLAIGYGFGSNDYGIPNFLRVFIGEENEQSKYKSTPEGTWETISLLETNIDDLNPEILAFTAEKLLHSGALDVFITPVLMKKSRLGSLLTVICLPESEQQLLKIIFQETTTLGVRLRREDRYTLPRKTISVETDYGTISVKVAGQQISPEYEDCQRLAKEKNIPLKEIYQDIIRKLKPS